MRWFHDKDGRLMIKVPWGCVCAMCGFTRGIHIERERSWTTTFFATSIWADQDAPYPEDCVPFFELSEDLQAAALAEML